MFGCWASRPQIPPQRIWIAAKSTTDRFQTATQRSAANPSAAAAIPFVAVIPWAMRGGDPMGCSEPMDCGDAMSTSGFSGGRAALAEASIQCPTE